MTTAVMRRVQQPVGRGWVQGMLCMAPEPRASVMLLPPFLHEGQRSYRLFALMADALAARGVSVLRFDYRGTGESSGEDAEFLPGRALDDADAMLAVLRQHAGAPVTLVGVRAGALLAERVAERHRLPWCAWQGVESGEQHLAELRERDAHERNNRNRFPFLGRHRVQDPGTLMGHRLHPEFALELGIFKRSATPSWCIDEASRCGAADIALPDILAGWVGQIDLQGALPLASIGALADAIVVRLLSPSERAA